NGIEAARRIRRLSPNSKILFVSQESSADTVQEALSTGAYGYVIKIEAGSELLKAVDAVLRGETSVANRFAGHNFTGDKNSQGSDQLSRINIPISSVHSVPRKAKRICRHEVLFYFNLNYAQILAHLRRNPLARAHHFRLLLC